MEISKMFEFLDNLYLLKKKNPVIIYEKIYWLKKEHATENFD